jgi:galactokinase
MNVEPNVKKPKRLQTKLEVTALCQLTPTVFEENRTLIGDAMLEKRAKHAIYEKMNEQH